MAQPSKPKKIKLAVIERLLGEEPMEKINRWGLQPAAVETWLRHPQDGAYLRAIVCRLYPTSDLARIRYVESKAQCSQAIVFPDPGDDLEISLLEGFHNAALVARRVVERQDYAVTAARPNEE